MKRYIKVIILVIVIGLIISGIFVYKKYCKSCNIEIPNTTEIISEVEEKKQSKRDLD